MAHIKEEVATVGGLRIRYVEAGQGRALLCLHGSGPGASGLSNFRHTLKGLSHRFRVIAPDLPGFGFSDRPSITERRVKYYADFVLAFMDALGIEGASLIGNSMGGGIACKVAIERPERVEALVLMGPSALGYEAALTPTPTEGIRALRSFYDEPITKERFAKFMRLFVFDPSKLDEEVVEERYRVASDPSFIEFYRRLPPSEELTQELHLIRAPTLIIWGLEDRFVPIEHCLLLLKKIKGAEAHIFSRCGHWAMIEVAEEFNRVVEEFLLRPRAQGRPA
jgi:4,5:9,10-diseco-3-hydroxy-5,9,17-trioxoandrosta-1(10),2-diene-4-oate hydrolase